MGAAARGQARRRRQRGGVRRHCPVTLTLALARDVPDAPAAGWWTKRVTHRRDASGRNTLTWTVGGGTYVMVSELEGAGLP